MNATQEKSIKGQIISGNFNQILARQKSGQPFELGEILVAEQQTKQGTEKMFLQVYDLQYGSQISQQNLELISGLQMEESADIAFMDPHMRMYTVAVLKTLLTISHDGAIILSKELPKVFTPLRALTRDDVRFLTDAKQALFLGNLRSGTKALDVPISLDGREMLTHHILISGTTGKGKSILMSNLLWECTTQDYCGVLVLDPHDEYYGRSPSRFRVLKDHPGSAQSVVYYSRNPVAGTRTLKIHVKNIRPVHFGCLDFSDAQEQAMHAYYRDYGEKWVESIILEKPLKVNFHDATISVLKRRLLQLLDLDFNGEQVFCNGVFDINAGSSTINDICNDLESAKTVIIDTSTFSGQVELLIGSLITSELFYRYKRHKSTGILGTKPAISIVLEEAPRVLGKDVLEKGNNIFSTIAREGRKFGVGLIAITQLPSLIPREILANMNTKIILGTEMAAERQALIDSAAHDLSMDDRNIASLDKGECIVSSNFAKFAIPISVPIFYSEKNKPSSSSDRRTDAKIVSSSFNGIALK